MRKILLCFALAGCAGAQPSVGVGPETLNVADAALSSGNPALALQVSRAILRHDPTDRGAKLHEAAALYALGRSTAAQVVYEQLYAIQPSTTAAAGLAKCLVRENPSRAVTLLQVAVNKAPDNIEFLTNLGVAEDLTGNHVAAQDAYQRALHLDPAQIPAQADLALSLALSGSLEAAVSMLEPLAKAQDSTARVRQDFGAVLALEGHPDQGAVVLAADLPLAQAHEAAIAYEALAKDTVDGGRVRK